MIVLYCETILFKKKFGDTLLLPCTHLPQLVDVLGGDLFNFHNYYWWFYCVSNIIQSQIELRQKCLEKCVGRRMLI